jgi:muramoyltetrapeptide carboxypeptidase
VHEGAAAGVAVGGNLSLVAAMAAAQRLTIPDGAIVFLEDVTERPYRIDRMLATLAVGGHLARAAAVVLGDFTQCDPGADGVRVGHVLRDGLRSLGVPVVSGLPVGHGVRNDPVVLGGMARVEASAGVGRLVLGG